MVKQELASKVQVLLGDHLAEHLGEFVTGEIRVHAFVLVRDHDVDAIGAVTNVLVNPVELDL